MSCAMKPQINNKYIKKMYMLCPDNSAIKEDLL